MGMHPRLFLAVSWADRSEGRVKYRLSKAWVPRPGVQSSSRTVCEGTMIIPSHTDDEQSHIADVLYRLAVQLSSAGE